MKKFLPRTDQNPRGFTLIELLVVISILAILSVIGFTVFTGTQKSARDARRKGDIDAIAKAMEINKVPGSTTYVALADAQFSSGTTPDDSGNSLAEYCVDTETTTSTPPSKPTTWTNATACPIVPASAYTQVSGGSTPNPPASTTSWTVCALMEVGATFYCKSSSQ